MSLLEDLLDGASASRRERPCPLCAAIEDQEDETTQDALRSAAAGTIGINKLVAILAANSVTDPVSGNTIGRRTIQRHRTEEHV